MFDCRRVPARKNMERSTRPVTALSSIKVTLFSENSYSFLFGIARCISQRLERLRGDNIFDTINSLAHYNTRQRVGIVM